VIDALRPRRTSQPSQRIVASGSGAPRTASGLRRAIIRRSRPDNRTGTRKLGRCRSMPRAGSGAARSSPAGIRSFAFSGEPQRAAARRH
jgi:hypothetical protein